MAVLPLLSPPYRYCERESVQLRAKLRVVEHSRIYWRAELTYEHRDNKLRITRVSPSQEYEDELLKEYYLAQVGQTDMIAWLWNLRDADSKCQFHIALEYDLFISSIWQQCPKLMGGFEPYPMKLKAHVVISNGTVEGQRPFSTPGVVHSVLVLDITELTESPDPDFPPGEFLRTQHDLEL